MICLNKQEIKDDKYFTLVPDYFTARIEPLVIRGFVPSKICKEVIQLNRNKELKTTLAPSGRENTTIHDYRNSDTKQDANIQQLDDYFNPSVLGKLINEAWNLDREYDWIPEVKKHLYTHFVKDQYCRNHCDVIWTKDGSLVRKSRRASVLLYLNSWAPTPQEDSFTGGELLFSSVLDDYQQCYSVKPLVGDLVIFPSNPNYYHSVTRVTSGERHNVVQWLKFK